MKFILAKIQEKSTILGILAVGTSLGLFALAPDVSNAIVEAILGVAGLIAVIIKERQGD
jgi:hypothetical protein